MASSAQIVVGSHVDYESLKKLDKTKKTDTWSCGKHTKDGNLLFFYLMKPQREIVASATASGDAFPTPWEDWPYMVEFENVKIMKRPITLDTLKGISDWGWPKHPRRHTYLDEPIANELIKLANLKRKPIPELPPKINIAGAGFGPPEQNRIVEKAACKAVRKHFKEQGFKIVSREKENLGYDFDASRNQEELHVEVKGISGAVAKFIITANELKLARTDLQFRVAAVTEALATNPKIHFFTGKEFFNQFVLTPTAYFAGLKSSLSA
jgi:hypothetical protein